MKHALLEFFYDKKRNDLIVEPCLGIKVFGFALISIFSIAANLALFVVFYYRMQSLEFWVFYFLVLIVNISLYSELIGTRLILKENEIILVKNVVYRKTISHNEIIGYKTTFMKNAKGEYPENLKIICSFGDVNFNEGLCSKKDLQKLYNYFEKCLKPRIK